MSEEVQERVDAFVSGIESYVLAQMRTGQAFTRASVIEHAASLEPTLPAVV